MSRCDPRAWCDPYFRADSKTASPERRRDWGMVTAEAALVLPIIAAFAMCMVYLVSIVLAKVATVDAARDAARALARGDAETHAIAQAHATAPDGSNVSVSHDGARVSVTVQSTHHSPGWLIVPLPAFTVESRATVEVESNDGAG